MKATTSITQKCEISGSKQKLHIIQVSDACTRSSKTFAAELVADAIAGFSEQRRHESLPTCAGRDIHTTPAP